MRSGDERSSSGAIVSYAGTFAATTTFTIQRPLAGRRQGRSCVALTKRNRGHTRCTRSAGLGRSTHGDVAGGSRFRFTGRVAGHKLTPGSYRLRAIPRNAAGAGPAVFTDFTVAR